MALDPEDLLTIEKYALQNAVKYEAVPQEKAVLGKIMGAAPQLRARVPEVKEAIENIAAGLNQTTPDEWRVRLNEIAPELLEELSVKKEPEKGLKALPDAEVGKVVMRFAPNPNGPPTIGSSRGMIVNSEYVKMYDGKFILRFDDTDPDQKRPMLEAYDWYVDDFKWLGVVPDEIVKASDRFDTYYEIAEQLIEAGHAYVCFCDGETFKGLKDKKQACPHRDAAPEENLAHWKKMLAGGYEEREAVLRIKTDISHKDPALRDWGAFRILKKDHPRPEIGDKYIVWPLLDFEGAIEDHLLGTTHIIRGKDLQDSGKRQKYIYDYLGWTYPVTLHWGRVRIEEFGKLSTSGIRRDIEAGVYTGWDDPRLPTVQAIRRRGIQPEALKKFMIEMGVGETDVSMSMESLYAENRKFVDPIAHRMFFVADPVELTIDGYGGGIVEAPLYPNQPEMRKIETGNTVVVTKEDAANLEVGSKIRLKDLGNAEITSMSPLSAKYIDNSMETTKKEKMKIIHWAPTNGLKVTVLGPDGNFSGIGERSITGELDKVVQFERFGFCRIDSVDGENVVAYFAHK
ncbi:Glutamine--tRNA ligase [Methanimicrococcus sp. At1]|uniref:Glutamate--tRNA ligase n=1 Tax=Methanimicrococcus hacksteinii TaxID=3028293 RepID=A0ABU3VNV1_9EURY|nr:glutamate--tRNA ligase [Methanimicrococcus sp. At1]MDV0445081.1 Glutamine--tRNA ligase [Methanimicrococcus sp. At1]